MSKSADDAAFRKVDRILGRNDDYLLMEDGRKVLSAQRAIYDIKGIKSCQYIQHSCKHLTVNILADENYAPDSISIITQRMKDVTKTDIKVDIALVDSLRKNKMGKTQFIIREFKGYKSGNLCLTQITIAVSWKLILITMYIISGLDTCWIRCVSRRVGMYLIEN